MKILYIVHDLSDAAVRKRVKMLLLGGADLVIAGFRRTPEPINDIHGIAPINLGQTFNGQFLGRIKLAFKQYGFLKNSLKANEFDVIIARNLESFGIAHFLKTNFKNSKLIFECLDIHRMMLRTDFMGIALRAIEAYFLKSTSLIITSSNGFIKNYFHKLQNVKNEILLLENKILIETNEIIPPKINIKSENKDKFIIGWFGIIRCKKSLKILSELAEALGEKIEIIIRGKPAYDEIPDFDDIVAKFDNIRFLGPYKAPEDLETIYSEIDFTWAIDFFEEGQNSEWLLPNRLYEGCYYQSVPIAKKVAETANYLDNLDIGINFAQINAKELSSYFKNLESQDYFKMKQKLKNVPLDNFVMNLASCNVLIKKFENL